MAVERATYGVGLKSGRMIRYPAQMQRHARLMGALTCVMSVRVGRGLRFGGARAVLDPYVTGLGDRPAPTDTADDFETVLPVRHCQRPGSASEAQRTDARKPLTLPADNRAVEQ